MSPHRYLPVTAEDEVAMLQTIGVHAIDELFADVPTAVRYAGRLPVSEALSEPDLLKHMHALARQNADLDTYPSFLGAGIYDHHIPVVIDHLVSRGEFYTAYTPYQPEISQGELQAIFEFQSYMCALTGMAVANASMYDGATAFAEAGVLAVQATNRKRLLVVQNVHPHARAVLATSARGLHIDVVTLPVVAGTPSLDALREALHTPTAAVMVQSPNFYGGLEDIAAIAQIAHDAGALCVVSANPLLLGILEAPGKLGADIVVGDAQPFGIAPSFGGPTCGYFAVQETHMRRLPGRLVGQTVDRDGKRGFVLTLQTREQHIRREKATSNICSNQALLALCASIYLSVMGKQGIQDVASQCVQKAHYAKTQLLTIPGVTCPYPAPTAHEFVIALPEPTTLDRPMHESLVSWVNHRLLDAGILGGYDLSQTDDTLPRHMLVAVTERRTRQEIDQFVTTLRGILA